MINAIANISPSLLEGGVDPAGILEKLDLGSRARNALRASGVRTIGEAANLDPEVILSLRNAGEQTIQEISRALMRVYITPKWLKSVAPKHRYPDATVLTRDLEEELKQSGWYAVNGPCTRGEQWMIEVLIADMERGKIEYKVCRDDVGIRVFRKGGVDISEEGED